MLLWVALCAMLALAVAFVAIPLFRAKVRQTGAALASIVAIAVIAAGLYATIGNPDVRSGRGEAPDVQQMIASLAARLNEQPDDIDGWKMLGRSYLTLGNVDGAIEAFENAIELEDGQDPQTLVNLGEALSVASGQQLTPRSIALFETALDLDPAHPGALFWSGMAAASRGERRLAANRWELLLATNPPPEIRGILEQRIVEWRGGSEGADQGPNADPSTTITVAASLSAEAGEALQAARNVFIIARDPAQPAPPVAVVRQDFTALPGEFPIGDGDAMIEGRSLSGLAEVEIVVRVSVSGAPTPASGDWFGSARVDPVATDRIAIVIDQRVP